MNLSFFQQQRIHDFKQRHIGHRSSNFSSEWVVDFGSDLTIRADLRPERADLGSERADLGPERGLGGGRTYGRTDVRTYVRTSGNSPLCPTGHRPFGAAAQKGEGEGEMSLMWESIGHQPLRGRCPKTDKEAKIFGVFKLGCEHWPGILSTWTLKVKSKNHDLKSGIW